MFPSGTAPWAALALALLGQQPPPGGPALLDRLAAEDPAALARDALADGDPARGAAVFYRPESACARCHLAGQTSGTPLGPDLTRPAGKASDVHLVESILRPSKVVAPGYETVTLATRDGRTVSGLLAEDRPDAVVLRDPAREGLPVTVPRAEIEQRADRGPSLMPAGLAGTLASRGEFLDLVRYLREVADKGPARALELRPDPATLAAPALPAYEGDVDHAGMIAGLGPANLTRGAAIYDRVCATCHGTKGRPGSMPTSLAFASGRFKNGGDPYAVYRTLTHGFGQMPAQTWMVPEQKYDVIHYLRETFLRADNPGQYAAADAGYLAGLPKGASRGPRPSAIEPWSAMDYGPSLMATIEVGQGGGNFAYKGVAVRLDPGPGGVSRGRSWLAYDHDTMRVAGAWDGDGFLDWHGINFDGRHETHPRAAGRVRFTGPSGPGWADPATGRFDDPRAPARDGRRYGPLPADRLRFRAAYRHGNRVVLSYSVGTTPVLESPGLDPEAPAVVTRSFELGPRPSGLTLQVANEPGGVVGYASPDGRVVSVGPPAGGPGGPIVAAVAPAVPGSQWVLSDGGDLRLKIPAGAGPLRFAVRLARAEGASAADALRPAVAREEAAVDLAALTRGGPPRWGAAVATRPAVALGKGGGPFAVDDLGVPEVNPWSCRVRPSGFDFTPDGRRAWVCTWDGDVWLVSGVDRPENGLSWRRFASGLFQPLGLKVVGGQPYVLCRDQIAVPRDLNGDGEADVVACFNSDHQVTESFHEFAMDLQTDAAGHFYYTKGARHGKTAVVPQHGTLLRVEKDGSRTEIVANGFRAPNGVCVNPDGTFFLTDQEGFWMPKNRINWVRPGNRFFGNLWGYTDVTDPSDSAMEPPVCWVTNSVDRSPAEVVRVEGDAWGPLRGALLNLSYGYGKVYVVPHERVGGLMQGGVCELPIPPLPSGVMRGRFHPTGGQLYAVGMFAWAGVAQAPGGFYRVRATGKPAFLPVGLKARRGAMSVTFSAALDPKSASDRANYAVKVWALTRSAQYGSPHVDEHPLAVASASLGGDGRTVVLSLPDLAPTWCMEIRYSVRGASGEPVEGAINNTVHTLGD